MLSTSPKFLSVTLLNPYVYHCSYFTRFMCLHHPVQSYFRHGVRLTAHSYDFENSNKKQVEQFVGAQLKVHFHRVFLAREV
jgi:hypothetical protein